MGKIHAYDDEFLFETKIVDITYSLRQQKNYHRDRVSYWMTELAEAQQKLEESYTTERQPYTGGENIIASVDKVAAARVQECERKLENHKAKVRRLVCTLGIWSNVDEETVYLTHGQISALDVFWVEPGKENNA